MIHTIYKASNRKKQNIKTPIITAKTSSSICTSFYSVIKWFMNRQYLLLLGHLASCNKNIFSTIIWVTVIEKWWFMLIEAYRRTLAINPELAFWKASLCRKIQTPPGCSPGNRWTDSEFQVTFYVREDSIKLLEWCRKNILSVFFALQWTQHGSQIS